METMNIELWLGSSWNFFRMRLEEEFLVFSHCENTEKSKIAGNDGTLSSQKRKVTVVKEQGLGISIKGGSDNKLPIIISRIFKGSAAEKTGKLYVGDSILTVNGESLTSLTHKQAVDCITNAFSPTQLEVKYIPEVNEDFWSKYNLDKIEWSNIYGVKKPIMNTDEKFMSINLCLITRNLMDLSMQRVVQVYSPDLAHCLKIRCCDAETAYDLFHHLHQMTHDINTTMVDTVNEQLIQADVPLTIKHFGWVKRSISSNKTSKRLFMALSDTDIMSYDTVPTSPSRWKQPSTRHPLIHSRLSSSEKKILSPHHTKKHENPATDTDGLIQEKTIKDSKNSNRTLNEKLHTQYIFKLRLANQQGISRHIYEVENNVLLTAWSSALVQGVKQATINMQHYHTRVWYKDKRYGLSLHLDKGISLLYDNPVKMNDKYATDQNNNKEKINKNEDNNNIEELKGNKQEIKNLTDKNKSEDNFIRKCSKEDSTLIGSSKVGLNTGGVGDVVWSRGFEKLKSSKDDAVRFLWLSFYREEEDDVGEDDHICFKFDLRTNPKPFVFALHSFTQAQLFRHSL